MPRWISKKDFATSKAIRMHFHSALLLEAEQSNAPMVQKKLAASFRLAEPAVDSPKLAGNDGL